MNAKHHFNIINKICFKNNLRKCNIIFKKLSDCYGEFSGFGSKSDKVIKLKVPSIAIKKDKRMSDKMLISILAHEMLHYSEWGTYISSRENKTMHTKKFCRDEKAIMQKLADYYRLDMTVFAEREK